MKRKNQITSVSRQTTKVTVEYNYRKSAKDYFIKLDNF